MTDNIMTLIDYLRKLGLQDDLDLSRSGTVFWAKDN